MKITLSGVFEYEREIMHGDDPETIKWFYDEILYGENLIVHSNKIGDQIGTIRFEKRDIKINEVD